jgi:hypothetical protein
VERAIETERQRLQAQHAEQVAEAALAEEEAVKRAERAAAALTQRARVDEAQYLRGEFDARVPLHTGKVCFRQQAALLLLLAESDLELSRLRALRETEVLSRVPLEGSSKLPPAYREANPAQPSALSALRSGTCVPGQLSTGEQAKFLLVQKLFHALDRRQHEQRVSAAKHADRVAKRTAKAHAKVEAATVAAEKANAEAAAAQADEAAAFSEAGMPSTHPASAEPSSSSSDAVPPVQGADDADAAPDDASNARPHSPPSSSDEKVSTPPHTASASHIRDGMRS